MSTLEIDFPDPNVENPFTDINKYTWDYNGVTWVRRTKGIIGPPPDDGEQYARVRDSGEYEGYWEVVIHPAAEVPEAPVNGRYFARFNAGWAEVTLNLGGIGDAPYDGVMYARRNAIWTPIVLADLPDFQDALDEKSDVGHKHEWSDILNPDTGAPYPIDPDTGFPVGLVEEAPKNGREYIRVDEEWQEATPPSAVPHNIGVTIMLPQLEDDATLLYTTQQMAITTVHAHILKDVATNDYVKLNIYYAPDRNGIPEKLFLEDITISFIAGQHYNTLSTNQIPINHWVWVEITYLNGNPEMLHLTLDYKTA